MRDIALHTEPLLDLLASPILLTRCLAPPPGLLRSFFDSRRNRSIPMGWLSDIRRRPTQMAPAGRPSLRHLRAVVPKP